MHICQKRGLYLDPQLFLDKSPIPVVEETKFVLGVIFDRKLSFIPHLKYVKKKASKALNILKVIGNTEWGADRKVVLRLYRSKLEYGCIVYGSARKSYLQMLDPIHNQGQMSENYGLLRRFGTAEVLGIVSSGMSFTKRKVLHDGCEQRHEVISIIHDGMVQTSSA